MPLTSPLLQTKFYAPPLISDFIERTSLTQKLEEAENSMLTLVSAPTGFGKSTVLSQWLQKQQKNFAWLSLDEQENDFKRFIIYFTYAIHLKNEHFGKEILDLQVAPELPTVGQLVELFVHEISQIKSDFFLVLDDYHLIRNIEVHHFVQKLCSFPVDRFHLILSTRRDPSLPLSEWRLKNIMVEIRAKDLRFSKSEISAFFQSSGNIQLNEPALNHAQTMTEGWISGLRLLLLLFSDKNDANKEMLEVDYNTSHIFQQLISDIIQKMRPGYTEYLLILSEVKEFNKELFAEFCLECREPDELEKTFNHFIAKITDSNLFLIAIDEKHNWYRFHHLFAEQLNRLFHERYEPLEIQEYQKRLAKWYMKGNYPEEAILLFLKAKQTEDALKIFSSYRLQMVSTGQFAKLEMLYKLFPSQIQKNRGLLMLSKAWIYFHKGNIAQMGDSCEEIKKCIQSESFDYQNNELLLAELSSLNAYHFYVQGDKMQACLKEAKHAVGVLKNSNYFADGLGWIFYAGAMQILKNGDEAKKELLDELYSCEVATVKAQLLLVLCYLDWFEGNLNYAHKTATQLIELGKKEKLNMALAHGHAFSALCSFLQMNDAQALMHFQNTIGLRHHGLQVIIYPVMFSAMRLYAEQGLWDKYDELVDLSESYVLSEGGKKMYKMYQAETAQVTFSLCNKQVGLAWAQKNDYTSFIPLSGQYNPEIVQAKILALSDNPEFWNLSQKILDQMIDVLQGRNNINFALRALVTKALVCKKQGKTSEAVELLQQSLDLSEVKNLIRPYVELGNEMKIMLLDLRKKYPEHIDSILSHFSNEAVKEEVVISTRELEILFLAEDHSNKEIANKLFIAETTVKRHIANIFKKLQASNRREALSKAKELNVV